MADRFLNKSAFPIGDRVTDPKTGLLTPKWQDIFARMTPTMDSICNRLNVVSLSGQTNSISAVDFSNGELLPGLYRLTYCTSVLSVGGGSIAVTFGWTDGGVARTFVGTTLTLGASDTGGAASQTAMARVDKGSPVTYAATFVGGQSYNLDVVIEKVYVL